MNAYSLFLIAGFFAALIYLKKQTSPLDFARLSACVWIGFLSGLIGAKALFAIIHPEPALLEGGMIFFGGLFLGAPVYFLCLYLNRKQIPMAKSIRVSLPALALGHAIGRLGCFIAGCCYGHPLSKPYEIPWAHWELQHFPIQLVETLGLFILFILLHQDFKKNAPNGLKHPVFRSVLFYGAGYGLIRSLCELSRSDPSRGSFTLGNDSLVFTHLAFTQGISNLMLILSLFGLGWLLFCQKNRGFSPPSNPRRSSP
jgi:phosphatidylglycerol:prolipoprotein diacylglycerol transferase